MKECKNFGTEMFLAGKMYTFTRKLDPGGWRKKRIMEENLKLGKQVKMVNRQENREESCGS